MPGIRKKKELVPEGRCDYLRASIILSPPGRIASFHAIPGTSCQATLTSPSGTIGRRATTIKLGLSDGTPPAKRTRRSASLPNGSVGPSFTLALWRLLGLPPREYKLEAYGTLFRFETSVFFLLKQISSERVSEEIPILEKVSLRKSVEFHLTFWVSFC